VNWNYVAQGGENRFAIGNFFANNTQIRTGNDCAASNLQGGTYSYYFIDDVSVTAGTCCITSVTDPGPLCVNDAPFNLVPQTPGGTFSGTGITNGSLGTFDPSVAGVGTFTISYQLGCGTGTFQMTVNNCTTLSVCQETNGALTVSGGTAPYTWQSQSTTQDCSSCLIGCTFPPGCAVNITSWNTYSNAATAMPPGTFPIQVLDNGGNSQLITSLAGIPACSAPCPTLTVTISNQEDISCFGLTDGAAVASASGGNGTYNYSWMPGSLSGASQNALDNTTYTITATDGNGCTGSTTVTIAEPAELLASVNTTPTDCGATTGSATASYTGGTGTVSYSWNPGGQTTAVISNVSAGVYTVTVEDQNGCTAQASGNVNTLNGPVLTTQVLQQVSCFNGADGSASVQVSGGTSPYNVVWSPSGETTTTAAQLEAGTNTITVTDAGGCVTTATVQITEPSAIQITGVVTNEQCGALDGAVDATFTGGTGTLTPSWSNGASTADINGLNNGTYTLTVTDQNGCSADQDFTVLQVGSLAASVSPTSASIDAGDSVSITVSGGSIFNWVPSTGLNCDTCATVVATPSETTIYVVIVSDATGCSDTLSVTIGVTPVCGELFVPNMFSPNLDNLNDQLCVMGACFSEVVFSIYNRWGELIFETDDLTKCWDGTYKSKAANPDVYVYKLIGTKLDGTDVNTSGNIQLVR
jgi:gliding motility-associated-like protein